MMLGKVYKVSNTVDSLVYVGSTFCSLESRWERHVASSQNSHKNKSKFYSHVQKLGAENFKLELLEAVVCESRRELELAEAVWIKKLGTLNHTCPRTEQERVELNRENVKNWQKTSEKYKARQKEKVVCPVCNVSVARGSVKQHKKSKLHLSQSSPQNTH